MIAHSARAFGDIAAALRLRGLSAALAAEDVADSHRRTMLGPFWPMLNYVLFAGTIIVILGPMTDGVNFTAYVAVGVLVWNFMSEILAQATTLFLREESFIKGTTLPVSVYVLRLTMSTALRTAYAIPAAIAFIVTSGVTPSAAQISVAPAALLILLTAPGVVILFGFAGVLFRDFPLLVSQALRILMFVTPIFWAHGGEGGLRGFLYHWNPLTHYIDIVRMPIVYGVIPITSWCVAAALSAVALAAALVTLGKFNRQIAFMV